MYASLRAALACGIILTAAAPATPAAAATAATRAPGAIDAERMKAAAADPGNWLATGRDSQGTYYSPLTAINSKNVSKLGFAWAYDLGTYRGQEATPIVVDGVMYTSGTWGYVYAVDAATGKQIWRYDPQAAHLAARNPCCDLVNRGVAVWEGQSVCRVRRWTAARARCGNRRKGVGSRHHHRSQDAVFEHRRATDRGTGCCHWQQRR